MLIYQLISNRRPTGYIILLVIWNLGLILGGVSIFLMNKCFVCNFLSGIFMFYFLAATIVWIVGNFFIKRYQIIGKIGIVSNSIKIITNNEKYFDINKIQNLIIRYYGIKGEAFSGFVGLLRIKDGARNFISFEYLGENYKYEFLITKKHFLNSIHEILKLWESNSVNFKILDPNNKDITSKVLNNQNWVWRNL